LPKLVINFTWWVNRIDPDGDHLFSGGFLGLDNISAVDRSNLPAGDSIEQADGTSWVAFYTLTLLQLARILAVEDETWTDIEVKFIQHFMLIAEAMQSEDLWDDADGFFYDVYRSADGTSTTIPVRSIVGVLPILGTVLLGPRTLGRLRALGKRSDRFLEHPDDTAADRSRVIPGTDGDSLMVSVIPPGNGLRILQRVFDEGEFLSPYGLRALSRHHADHPASIDIGGDAENGRLRAGRVEHRDVRRQLELAGSGLDAGELSDRAQPAAVRFDIRRRRRRRVPDRERHDVAARRMRRRSASSLDLAVRARRGRAAPLPRLRGAPSERPSLARQHHVLRVLPRRQRCRARRLPPDRLDRSGRRPDLSS
jgi:hypothetical protein